MILFREYMRRSWKLTALAAAGLFAFQIIVIRVMASGVHNIGQFLPAPLQSFLGIDQLPLSTLPGQLSLAYQHPFVLLGFLAVPVAIASGSLVAEVERKTIGLLLARRVSSVGMVLATAAVCIVACAILVIVSVCGTLTGVAWMGIEPGPDGRALARVGLALFMLGLAVSGLAILFSAWTSERSDAIGWTLTLTLIMYVWNFLAQLWVEAKPYIGFSLFHYYGPQRILVTHSASVTDSQVLGINAAASVVLACLVYRFRDFHV